MSFFFDDVSQEMENMRVLQELPFDDFLEITREEGKINENIRNKFSGFKKLDREIRFKEANKRDYGAIKAFMELPFDDCF